MPSFSSASPSVVVAAVTASSLTACEASNSGQFGPWFNFKFALRLRFKRLVQVKLVAAFAEQVRQKAVGTESKAFLRRYDFEMKLALVHLVWAMYFKSMAWQQEL